MRKIISHACQVLATALLGGCASAPEGLQADHAGFQADRYLGTWYEIARLEHSFERGLSKATARILQEGRRQHSGGQSWL